MGSPRIDFFRITSLENEFNNGSRVWRCVINYGELGGKFQIQKVFNNDEIEFVESWKQGIRLNYKEIVSKITNNS